MPRGGRGLISVAIAMALWGLAIILSYAASHS